MKRNRNNKDEDQKLPIKKSKTKEIVLPLPKLPKTSGIILSCGQNDVGQLGFNEVVSKKSRPAVLPIKATVIDACAGGMHSLYLTENGHVYSFGCNDEGALGRDTSVEGSEYEPTKINLPEKCVKLSAGDSHSACLLVDGRVYAWGSFRDSRGSMGLTINGKCLLPIEIASEKRFVQISSGSDHLVMLSVNGDVYTVGCAEQGQLGRVTARSCTGESRSGKTILLIPTKIYIRERNVLSTKFDEIWTTNYCTFMRSIQTKAIYACGLNNYNQLGLNKSGDPVYFPCLSKFKNVKSLYGGQHHTLVQTDDMKCHAIGRKDYGRLGIPNLNENVEELTLIEALAQKTTTKISCGEVCSYAITSDGKIYAWGMGSNYQLGMGSDVDIFEPTLISLQNFKENNIISVSGGGQHSLFIVQK